MKSAILLFVLLSTVLSGAGAAQGDPPQPSATPTQTLEGNVQPQTQGDKDKEAAGKAQESQKTGPGPSGLKVETESATTEGTGGNPPETGKALSETKPPTGEETVKPGQKETGPKAEVKKPDARTQEWLKDRPWIIRPRASSPEKISGKDKKPDYKPDYKWDSSQQEAACRAHLTGLEQDLNKARYYSIQGDTCRTADHAESFLKIVSACEKDCPKEFLKAHGYNDEIIRNLRVLRELGKKRCLGPQ